VKTTEELLHEIELLKHCNDVLSRDLMIADQEIDRLKAEFHYLKEQDGRPYTPSLKTPPESK